jgi:hypothetical protein
MRIRHSLIRLLAGKRTVILNAHLVLAAPIVVRDGDLVGGAPSPLPAFVGMAVVHLLASVAFGVGVCTPLFLAAGDLPFVARVAVAGLAVWSFNRFIWPLPVLDRAARVLGPRPRAVAGVWCRQPDGSWCRLS